MSVEENRPVGGGRKFAPGQSKVCVMGLGYIGLPTASILANKGYDVFGVDVRPDVVDTINRGQIHIEEPDLDILVRSAVNSGQLKAGLEPQPADIFFICVPTPINPDHSPDLSFVEQASRAIRPHVRQGNLIILESTSPPLTTDDIVLRHAVPDGMVPGRDIFVAHCPERVLPGRILLEAVQNDRVVGGITPTCARITKEFYQTFVNGEIFATSAKTAEVTKLVENAYRDVNIAFANELSILADHLEIDPWELISLANRHPRVNILNPGPGVGGHCISVDPWFLVHTAPQFTPLIRTAREVNDAKPHHVVEHVARLARQFHAPKIGCLGLTYKSDVDDLRESPSLEIVRDLRKLNLGEVLACDPYVSPKRFTEFPLHALSDVVQQSQVLVLLTDHRQFRDIPKKVLQEKVVVDTRGVWR
ncbi:MAG TPA: UDP-N-acetyl-D-mannosamine dehydrogenase [Pirellulales bacterium]|nr:UDP-N-acetyl-D-mannosamine dehydrogenase [Pirellulales bacterium]